MILSYLQEVLQSMLRVYLILFHNSEVKLVLLQLLTSAIMLHLILIIFGRLRIFLF